MLTVTVKSTSERPRNDVVVGTMRKPVHRAIVRRAVALFGAGAHTVETVERVA